MSIPKWLRAFRRDSQRSAESRGRCVRPQLFALESRALFAVDPTFGVAGLVYTDLSSAAPDRAWDVAIQPDGKIVAVGLSDGDFGIARYNPDGTLDTTFGSGGRVTTDFAGGFDRANAVALQSDGKIVVAGVTGMFMGADFALARYNTDGSLDESFGAAGRVTTNSGFSVLGPPDADAAFDVAIQPDGKIIAVGVAEALTEYGVHSDFMVARYNSDGTLDATFGVDEPRESGFPPLGVVTTNFGGLGDPVVATMPDIDEFGAWLGTYHTFETSAFSEVLYGLSLPEGYALNDMARAVALAPDGTIIVVGGTERFTGAFSSYSVARYSADGSPIQRMVANLGPNMDEAHAIVLLEGGDFVIAGGVSSATGGPDVGLMRYDASGYPDAEFSGDGVVINSLSAGGDIANAIVEQADGRFVIAGATGFTGFMGDEIGLDVGAPPRLLGGDLFIARYMADGALDATFADGGISVVALGDVNEQLNAAALQSDGMMVVAGIAVNPSAGTGDDFFLLRDTLTSTFPSNTPPVAADDAAATVDWAAVTIAVLANDTDPDGDSLSIASVSAPVVGSVSISGGSIVYTPAINFSGSVEFTYTIDDGHGGTDTGTVTVEVEDTTPPQVVDVSVRGTTWTKPAYSIPVGSGAQLRTLPWINLNQISVRFSEDVSVTTAALAVHGVRVKTYRILSFSYDSTTHTATWTLRRKIVNDKVLLDLVDTMTDAAGNSLDGEWTNPTSVDAPMSSSFPSGDGADGGRFRFRFNVLAGDFNQSRVVTAADAMAVRELIALGSYDPLADVNGDGVVNLVDLRQIRARIGSRLPIREPVLS